MSLGKRLFAWAYHYLLSGQGYPNLDDPMTQNVRIPLLSRARGDVLEVGAGDGANLPLYRDDIRLTLLEPNPYMYRYLEDRCKDYEFVCEALVEGYGENIPYPDGSFDTVVAIHVLCSVADQSQVLAEIKRVLRPGGQMLFLEHVAASPQTAVYRFQNIINPVWRMVGDGCHLNRDTASAIYDAGFTNVELVDFEASTFPWLVGPHISGAAYL